MGAGDADFVHFSQKVELTTGSFMSSYAIADSPSGTKIRLCMFEEI